MNEQPRVNQKIQMLKEIFPSTITQINFATVDLDISMLGIADILRNADRTFPQNTSTRNAIANGTTAIAVLCKSVLLKPMDGLIIVICSDVNDVRIQSKNYIVMSVAESTISSQDKILDLLDKLTTYLISNYGSIIPSFEKFYSLHVYDAYEMEE